jgi:hypothetical protein
MNETVEVENVIEAFKLFCFCNHGGEDALLEDAAMILKEEGINYDIKLSFSKKGLKREMIYEPKEESRKMEQEEEITRKIEKMNLLANERQVNEVLQKHVAKNKFSQDQVTITYKVLSDMLKRKKGNEKWVLVDELLEQVRKAKDKVEDIETLNAIL